MENNNQIKNVKLGRFKIFLKAVQIILNRIFRGKWTLHGVPEITTDELYEKIKSNDSPLIIDTRDRKEFYAAEGSWRKYGHIEGAKCIPILELSSSLTDLLAYKDEEIGTFCPGGGLSLVAAEVMTKAGFTDVKSVKGGMDGWDKNGYPTVTGKDLGVTLEDIQRMNDRNKTKKEEIEQTADVTYEGEIHDSIDAKGLSCPGPILISRKAIVKLEIGQVLEILTTDPGSKTDIPAWVKMSGHELLYFEEIETDKFRFIVKRQR